MAKRKFFSSSSHRPSQPAAHMTWASKSVATTVAKTRRFLSRQLWAWPIVAVFFLTGLGWFVNGRIERTMEASLRSELQTLLDVEVAMLQNWMVSNESIAMSLAADTDIRHLAIQIAAAVDTSKSDDGPNLVAQLQAMLRPAMNSHDYENFVLLDRQQVIAASRPDAVGLDTPVELQDLVTQVFDGKPRMSRPFKSRLAHTDQAGTLRAGIPMMFVLAPVLDEQLQVVAALGLQIRPEAEFTRILQLGQPGATGETYAFDANGLMLSNSRFDDEMKLDGVLSEHEASILNLLVRDPGGDITSGYRPERLRSQLPLTRMVMLASQGEPGVDVDGYRDYRGVQVVGAWTWLADRGMGVATEMDSQEAYRPLMILKRTFGALLLLLGVSSVAIFVATLMMSRLQRQAREAAIEAKQLGQYQLEEKLGEGAMGVVYRGRHAMLRRPTAIKLLNTDQVSESSIERFEREVQITSHLNHPNTIAVYDYGRTPEGIFYYAMEYLDGINLQTLVDSYGPQPAGRVIHILKQVCGSLYEAHSAGLVHRDIKPANIMINRRGAEGDVVKVLDFGLVKARDEAGRSDGLAGTPLYMSPEAIQLPGTVDACSDLYAVGAVGYFLLTGHPVFEADNLVDLCQRHTSETPISPSERRGEPVPAELELAILACLEKSRAKRPQTARELTRRLESCPAVNEWSLDQADNWWSTHERGARIKPATSTTSSGEHDATILYDP